MAEKTQIAAAPPVHFPSHFRPSRRELGSASLFIAWYPARLSAATTAHQPNTRRATTPPSAPDHAPADHDHRPGTPNRTLTQQVSGVTVERDPLVAAEAGVSSASRRKLARCPE